MKIFNWYIVSDLDMYIYTKSACMELSKRNAFLEKINGEQYQEIEKLKKENLMLRNNQKIEIINLI